MIIHNPVITGSLQVNGSSVASIESLDSTSGSVAALNNATSSYALENSISGSFTSTSESLASRVASQESFSSSLDATFATDADLNLVSSSVDSLNAATSSYLQNTTDTLTGDLTVTGTITAQEFHTEYVSASITFESGSHKFGDTLDDIHQFTGSLKVSSSIYTTSQTFTTQDTTINSTNTSINSTNITVGNNTTDYVYIGDSTLNVLGGKVGIGITSPAGDLEISGSGNSNRTITFNPVFNDDISISSMGVDASGYNAMTIGQANSTNNSGVLRFKYAGAGSTNNHIGLGFYANDDILVVKASGKVGIGIVSPARMFHVQAPDNNIAAFESDSYGMVFQDNSSVFEIVGYKQTGGTYNDIHIRADVSNSLVVKASTGNVGIGTASPSSTFHVNGYTTIGRYGAPHYSQSGMAYQVIRATTDDSARALLELHSGNQGVKANVQAVGANNTAYFGTLTNSNASYGNDVEAFYFNTAGNVGLGTTNNTHKLVVKGTSAALTSDSSMRFFIDRVDATQVGSLIFSSGGASTSNGWAEIGQTDANGDLYFKANASAGSYDTRMVIKGSSGNVGIGTSSPLAPLHVHTGAAASATGSFQDNTAIGIESTSDQYIEMLTSGGSNGQMQGMLFSDNGRNAFIGYKEYTGQVANTKGEALHLAFYDYSSSDTNNGIYFGTSTTPWLGVDTTHMFIKGNGNVGIGTTSPIYKLQVQKTSASVPAFMVGGAYSGGPRIQTYGLDADANAWMGLGTDMGGFPYEHSVYFPQRTGYDGVLTFGSYDGTTYSTKMIIRSTGKIGINTTNPQGLLNIHLTENTDSKLVRISGASNIYKDLQWKDTTSGEMWIWSHRTDSLGNAFEAWYNDGTNWNSTSTLSLRPNGNVGLGIESSKAQLHINDGGSYNNTDTNNRLFIESSTKSPYMLFSSADEKDNGIHFHNTADNAFVGRIAYQHRSAGDKMWFRVGTSSGDGQVVINSNGDVGIGTSSPEEPLHIQETNDSTLLLKSTTNGNGVIYLEGPTRKWGIFAGSNSGNLSIKDETGNNNVVDINNDNSIAIDSNKVTLWQEIGPATTEVSFTGTHNAQLTLNPTSIPSAARFVLADVFITADASDHQNFMFSKTNVGSQKNWVNTRGQQPSSQFGTLTGQFITTLTYNGESDGYSPNYGMWYANQHLPVNSSRQVYINNYGNSNSNGYIYIVVKAFTY